MSLPEHMKHGPYAEWYQAIVNQHERRGDKIVWNESGPNIDYGNGTLMNISIEFMYPPMFNLQEDIDRLNDPSQDRKVVTLTVAQITEIRMTLRERAKCLPEGDSKAILISEILKWLDEAK